MRGFFAHFNAELARRCLQPADASHTNYWGLSVPLALLGLVGSFAWTVVAADPRLTAGPLLLGLYLGYVLLNAGRLGAGSPLEPATDAGPVHPWAVYAARLLGAVLPLWIESWMAVAVYAVVVRPGPEAWLVTALGLDLAIGVAGAIGLFWGLRLRTVAKACHAAYWTVVLVPWLLVELQWVTHNVRWDNFINEPYLASLLQGFPAWLLLFCFAFTPVVADSIGRIAVTGGTSSSAPPAGSFRFLGRCLWQSLTWGAQPWARWIRFEQLRESWYAIGLVGVLLLGLSYCSALTWVSSRGPAELVSCEANEKNIGTALEMYSTDNSGRYPISLQGLIPNYLRTIPTCPAAGTDTYSASYRSTTSPDRYSFYCRGAYHQGQRNFPRYDSAESF